MSHKKNILLICEGKDDKLFLQKIIEYYPIDVNYEIYVYETNLHIFANFLFKRYLNDSKFTIDDLDILQVLKEYRNESVLFEKYTDILLVFDFDPQDSRFDIHKVRKLINLFSDSTNHGQLYINYPMVESAIDFTTLPDFDFNNKVIDKELLYRKGYKNLIKNTSVIKSISNIDDSNLFIILKHTYSKMLFLTDGKSKDYNLLLEIENEMLENHNSISIINTSMLFTRDYNETMFLDILMKGTAPSN